MVLSSLVFEHCASNVYSCNANKYICLVIVLYLCIYIAILEVHTNQKRYHTPENGFVNGEN